MKKYTPYIGFVALLLTACAQFVPPTGGKKDEIPPELVESIPKNQSRSVKSQQLILTFNEAIDATGLRQDLIISPELTGGYEVKSTLKMVTLKFNKPLLENTTYTFNFRNGIKDLNERNPAKNLKIVFSSGETLDSLGIKGKVTILQTNKPASEVLVGLYALQPSDTLPYFARKPDYFMKTDTTGKYQFENLKGTNYRLMAFQDKNNNLLPDPPVEWLGFVPDTVLAGVDFPEHNFSIYQGDKKEPKIKRKLARIQNHSLTYDKSIESYQINWVDSTQAMWVLKKPGELLFIPKGTPPTDTLLVDIVAKDSVGNQSTKREKIYFLTGNPSKRAIQTVNFSTQPTNNSQLIQMNQLELIFPVPMTRINPDLITLALDSTIQQPWEGKWTDENQTNYLMIFEPIKKIGKWTLQLQSSAFTSYQGDTTTTRSFVFEMIPKEETGVLKINLTDSCKICLLEWNKVGENIPHKIPITKNTRLENLIPGDYTLRLFYDENQNGRWDNGDYKENKPAERIYSHPTTIRLKANFEIEQTINNPVEKKEYNPLNGVERTGDN
jgi:hypothetical protein